MAPLRRTAVSAMSAVSAVTTTSTSFVSLLLLPGHTVAVAEDAKKGEYYDDNTPLRDGEGRIQEINPDYKAGDSLSEDDREKAALMMDGYKQRLQVDKKWIKWLASIDPGVRMAPFDNTMHYKVIKRGLGLRTPSLATEVETRIKKKVAVDDVEYEAGEMIQTPMDFRFKEKGIGTILTHMVIGDHWVVYVPGESGWDNKVQQIGGKLIPAGAALAIEIEMLSIRDPEPTKPNAKTTRWPATPKNDGVCLLPGLFRQRHGHNCSQQERDLINEYDAMADKDFYTMLSKLLTDKAGYDRFAVTHLRKDDVEERATEVLPYEERLELDRKCSIGIQVYLVRQLVGSTQLGLSGKPSSELQKFLDDSEFLGSIRKKMESSVSSYRQKIQKLMKKYHEEL